MQPLKATVQKGRLVLDEPTDLPEGEVVYLHPAEAAVGDDDGFDDDERAALLHRTHPRPNVHRMTPFVAATRHHTSRCNAAQRALVVPRLI